MSQEELTKKIQKAKRYCKLVKCARTCLEDEGCYDIGYVVDANDRYVLLHLVSENIRLDGYVVLRMQDITDVTCDFENYEFIEKALGMRKMEPERPVLVDLNSIETVLRSIEENFRLMVVHRESSDENERFAGMVETIGGKTFTLRAMDEKAKWSGSKRIRFDEVTRIEFDGGYETALAQVAGIQ